MLQILKAVPQIEAAQIVLLDVPVYVMVTALVNAVVVALLLVVVDVLLVV